MSDSSIALYLEVDRAKKAYNKSFKTLLISIMVLVVFAAIALPSMAKASFVGSDVISGPIVNGKPTIELDAYGVEFNEELLKTDNDAKQWQTNTKSTNKIKVFVQPDYNVKDIVSGADKEFAETGRIKYNVYFQNDENRSRVYTDEEVYIYFSPGSVYTTYRNLYKEIGIKQQIIQADEEFYDYYMSNFLFLELYLKESLPQNRAYEWTSANGINLNDPLKDTLNNQFIAPSTNYLKELKNIDTPYHVGGTETGIFIPSYYPIQYHKMPEWEGLYRIPEIAYVNKSYFQENLGDKTNITQEDYENFYATLMNVPNLYQETFELFYNPEKHLGKTDQFYSLNRMNVTGNIPNSIHNGYYGPNKKLIGEGFDYFAPLTFSQNFYRPANVTSPLNLEYGFLYGISKISGIMTNAHLNEENNIEKYNSLQPFIFPSETDNGENYSVTNDSQKTFSIYNLEKNAQRIQNVINSTNGITEVANQDSLKTATMVEKITSQNIPVATSNQWPAHQPPLTLDPVYFYILDSQGVIGEDVTQRYIVKKIVGINNTFYRVIEPKESPYFEKDITSLDNVEILQESVTVLTLPAEEGGDAGGSSSGTTTDPGGTATTTNPTGNDGTGSDSSSDDGGGFFSSLIDALFRFVMFIVDVIIGNIAKGLGDILLWAGFGLFKQAAFGTANATSGYGASYLKTAMHGSNVSSEFSTVEEGYIFLQNISLLFMVLMVVWYGFSAAVGDAAGGLIAQTELKDMFPRLVIAIFMIGISANGQIFSGSIFVADILLWVTDSVTVGLLSTDLYANIDSLFNMSEIIGDYGAPNAIAALFFLLIAAVMFILLLSAAFLFIARLILIWILVLMGPLAWLFYVNKTTQNITTQWLKMLSQTITIQFFWLVMILIFCIIASMDMTTTLGLNQAGTTVSGTATPTSSSSLSPDKLSEDFDNFDVSFDSEKFNETTYTENSNNSSIINKSDMSKINEMSYQGVSNSYDKRSYFNQINVVNAIYTSNLEYAAKLVQVENATGGVANTNGDYMGTPTVSAGTDTSYFGTIMKVLVSGLVSGVFFFVLLKLTSRFTSSALMSGMQTINGVQSDLKGQMSRITNKPRSMAGQVINKGPRAMKDTMLHPFATGQKAKNATVDGFNKAKGAAANAAGNVTGARARVSGALDGTATPRKLTGADERMGALKNGTLPEGSSDDKFVKGLISEMGATGDYGSLSKSQQAEIQVGLGQKIIQDEKDSLAQKSLMKSTGKTIEQLQQEAKTASAMGDRAGAQQKLHLISEAKKHVETDFNAQKIAEYENGVKMGTIVADPDKDRILAAHRTLESATTNAIQGYQQEVQAAEASVSGKAFANGGPLTQELTVQKELEAKIERRDSVASALASVNSTLSSGQTLSPTMSTKIMEQKARLEKELKTYDSLPKDATGVKLEQAQIIDEMASRLYSEQGPEALAKYGVTDYDKTGKIIVPATAEQKIIEAYKREEQVQIKQMLEAQKEKKITAVQNEWSGVLGKINPNQ